MTEQQNQAPNEGAPDQDAEPSLNAPGDAGPTGSVAGGDDAGTGADRNSEDQDAEPSLNAPGDAGPTGISESS